MSLGFTVEDMREQLLIHERERDEYDGVSALEPLARTRRWLALDGSRELFASAAKKLERSMLAKRHRQPRRMGARQRPPTPRRRPRRGAKASRASPGRGS